MGRVRKLGRVGRDDREKVRLAQESMGWLGRSWDGLGEAGMGREKIGLVW